MVVRSAKSPLGGDSLRPWHNKFGATGTSQTCKDKEEFKVATAEAGEVIKWVVLETIFCTIAYLEARFMYWYVSVVVTFTKLTGGTETLLTKKTW